MPARQREYFSLREIYIGFSVLALLTIVAIPALYFIHIKPGGDGVLASVHLPDGSDHMVTQRCNWVPGEPYNVAFYMKEAGGRWGWCYIDHQADRWRKVTMDYDDKTDKVIVRERGKTRAVLDRKREMFWINTFDDGGREVPAPQEYRDPEIPLRYN